MSDPYWRYVTKLARYGGGGGSKKWRCSFCGIEKTGSVTRVKDHLGHVLGKDIDPCASVPADVKNSLAHWRATRLNICDPEEEGINVEAEGNTSQSQGEASSKRSRRGSPPASAHVSSTSAGGPGAKRINELREVWESRWNWFHRPIHAVAHVLHPLWRSEDQCGEEELEEGFQDYVQRYTRGDVEMARRLEDDLLAFRNESGHFGRATAKLRNTQLQPVSWWEKYGNSTPTLRRLAIRVLSQDCAVGPCERNWSTWALFHTKKRNKLTTLQLERLVFCNCNLQLLDRLSNSPEPTHVNVDKIDIEKVRDIPDIPQEERDLYALLYEEAIAPVHDTRRQRQQRRGRRIADVGTSAAAGPSESSSSASSEESHEDEVQDEIGDGSEDSDA
ncbi:hypothetical protein L7F22_000126 [Adiantum nelumboides]|nr:hypothetical protein [Adiantum nelumboides]